MNIQKAAKRLTWRFNDNRTFKPNQNDAEALNQIIDYINKKEKQQLIDNQLFGKLYIYLLDSFISHYKTTEEDSIPQKELHRILNATGKTLIQKFTDNRNLEALELQLELKKNIEDLEPIEIEEASTNLAAMINAAINSYSK
jgi:hypothetical protein